MLGIVASLALAMAAAVNPTYLALGDSTGVGVGARRGGGYPARLVSRLEAGGQHLRLVNACVSGARVADVLAKQLRRGLAAGPQVVTLGIGINDVTQGTDLARLQRDYERLGEALAGTGAKVVVINVPDLSRSPLARGEAARRAIRQRVEAVNAIIAAAARRHGFALVDLFSATEAELATSPGLLAEDRFHPSDAGYERWADTVQPAFVAAVRAGAGLHGAALSTGQTLR